MMRDKYGFLGQETEHDARDFVMMLKAERESSDWFHSSSSSAGTMLISSLQSAD